MMTELFVDCERDVKICPRIKLDDNNNTLAILYLNIELPYPKETQKKVNDTFTKYDYRFIKLFCSPTPLSDVVDWCDEHHVQVMVVPDVRHLGGDLWSLVSIANYIKRCYNQLKIHTVFSDLILPTNDDLILSAIWGIENYDRLATNY